MYQFKTGRQNTTKTTQRGCWVVSAVVAVLAPLYVLATGVESYAAPYVDWVSNSNRVRRFEGNRDRGKPQRGWLLNTGRVLFVGKVVGPDRPTAHLGFPNVNRFVQAGPSSRDSFFSSPCTLRDGSFKIAWVTRNPGTGTQRREPCKISQYGRPPRVSRNIYIAQSTAQRLDVPISQNIAQGSDILIELLCLALPSLPSCRSGASITVSPTDDSTMTLIQAQAPSNGTLQVDVVRGAVTIESAKSGQIITVEAGNQYIEPSEGQGEVVDITSEIPQIISSPSMQVFLDPANWSSNNATQIEEFKTALDESPETPESPEPETPAESEAPVISDVKLREETSPEGLIIYQDIYFSDSDGDASYEDHQLISSTTSDVRVSSGSIDIPSDQQKAGAITTGTWRCGRGTYSATLQVTLVDKNGNRSNGVEYTVNCRTLGGEVR